MFKNFCLVFFVLLISISATSAQSFRGDSSNNGNNCGSRGNDRHGGDDDDDDNGKLRIYGLTSDGRLICFSENNPRNARTVGTISGFSGADTAMVGIDFRVQDGLLYGVGNAGGVYRISTTNAAATFVNSLTVPLNGTAFGVDFNPAADRLRIISDTGQNLRHNVNAGGTTINDGTLSYTPPTAATGVTGAAYTNNDLDPNTATTLYDIDSTLDQVAIQSPANSGTLAATGKLTVDTTAVLGFDIYSTIRNDTTVNVEGFAVLTSATDNSIRLYSIALFSGKATVRGTFSSQNQVVDIAIPLNQR